MFLYVVEWRPERLPREYDTELLSLRARLYLKVLNTYTYSAIKKK